MINLNPFSNFKRKAKSEIAVHLVVSIIFMIVALSYIYILVWAIIAGLKTHNDIVMDPFGLPKIWQWEHYIEVFEKLETNGTRFIGMFFNSIWFSIVPTALTQWVSVTFAYACIKYKFPGSGFLYSVVLVVLTLPIYGSAGAAFKLHHQLGLINNYAMAFIVGGFNMAYLYYYAFFKNMSWTYAEAAMMDGANDFQIYYKVMLPQAKSIIGAMFLTSWIVSWNSYEQGLVYYPKLPTLPVGIYQFNQEMIYRARLDILFAACVMITIPALILFTAFNKTLTTNVSVGGIKG